MFGPGLFESVYERLLGIELERRGHQVKHQQSVSFAYEDVLFKNAFRIDLLVDEEVLVELKSTSQMHPVYPKQLRTYLVLTNKKIGLLVNFGMETLKDGFVRVINGKLPNVSSALPSYSRTIEDLDLSLDKQDDLCTTQLCASAPLRESPTHTTPSSLCASAPLRESPTHTTPSSLCASAPLRESPTHTTPSSLCASAPLRENIGRNKICN